MANETRKVWINTKVVTLLQAAHLLLEVAVERANANTPGKKRPVMPAAYRNELDKLKEQINRTQTKFSGTKGI